MPRLDHINIHARDVAAMAAFLEAIVGAKPGFRPPFEHPGHWLYLDGLPAIHLDHARGDEHPGGVVDHLAFGVYDYEPLIARVKASGYPYQLAGIPGGVGQVFVTGPEGIRIELQYHR
ncbi:MAG TPA: glyoxalase [Alphaproteobacteria bacterium]|nr:glyoxalase [Alphaproteobacteria bacterium]